MLQSGDIQSVFFLGIGGIGMSALARYFSSRGYRVCGYDRTPSPLTERLEKEGLVVGYEDSVAWLDSLDISPMHTLVVRTPAVPLDNAIYQHLCAEGFDICKRAEVLGLIARQMRALCVAGTHGKTTTSTMLAHLMYQSEVGTNAFLGGISLNYTTNLLLQRDSSNVVVEADEYDRSFHHLQPYMSIITSADPDHLDIYGTAEAYKEAFAHYTSLVSDAIVVKYGIDLAIRARKGCKVYTYGLVDTAQPMGAGVSGIDVPDFYANNIRVVQGQIYFDFHTPKSIIEEMVLGVPVWVNIENAVAAMAVAWLNGVTDEELRHGLHSFKGVQRRFNIYTKQTSDGTMPSIIYVDDYAHHPQEIKTAIDSIRKIYPEYKLIGLFQPHLYTRTRDFASAFAQTLSTLDELVLLPIYPAREEPIEGVNSEMLMELVKQYASDMRVTIVAKENIMAWIDAQNMVWKEQNEPIVLLTIGAGDIDRLVVQIKEYINKKQ